MKIARTLRAERMKLRRAPLWIAYLVLPLIPAVMGSFNYLQNTGILTQTWASLWTQHTLFSCYFFTPVLIGASCAYQWRLEHLNHNWNQLMTQPVRPLGLLSGKLLVAAALVALTQLLTGALFFLSGRLIGFDGLPLGAFAGRLALGLLGGVAICSVQLMLSMAIRSFAVPVALSLMGGVAGLAAASQGLGLFFPYSLIALGMNANGMDLLNPGQLGGFLASCAAFTALGLAGSRLLLARRDIRA